MTGIKWYPGKRAQLDRDIATALAQTAEAVKTDLVQSQTLPWRTGQLQGSVFSDIRNASHGRVAVVTSTPYARRLYFHPEYNFYKGENPKAGGEWYRPYLKGGAKSNFAKEAFKKRLRAVRGR